MKLGYTFILLLLLCGYKSQQKPLVREIGIGILTVNTQYDIPLFKNLDDKTPIDVLKFNHLKSGKTAFDCKVSLKPYLMYEGDSDEEAKENIDHGLIRFFPELKFIVIEETPDYFRVIVDEDQSSKYYIKKKSEATYYLTAKDFYYNNTSDRYKPQWYIYETWERYLKRVEFIELNVIEIYDKPNGKIIFSTEPDGFLSFGVEKMEGEWIKLKKDMLREFNYPKGINYEGWYRWKKGNVLRIAITEATYE